MSDSAKPTEDPDFKGGVMSPNSKRSFAELRNQQPVVSAYQKLILDEDKFENNFLRCQVCRDRYNMTDRAPRLFPCHHAFCQSCVMSFYHQEAEYRQSMAVSRSSTTYAVSISCPTCKANFITTEEGIRQLTTDHRIIQLLDFVGHTDKQTVTYCPTHSMQPINFFCENCAVNICRDCTVIDHKQCAKDKLVVDISNALKKYMPAVEEGKNNLTGELLTLEDRKTECEKALETCEKGDDTLTIQIQEMFTKIRAALDKREEELLDIAKSGQPNCAEIIDEKMKKLTDKRKDVERILNEIDTASASGSITELFHVYKQLRSYKTEPALDRKSLERKDDTVSTFQARDEMTLLARIGNFGDIQTKSNSFSGGYSSTSYSTGSSYIASSRYGGGYTGSSYTSRYTPTTTRSYKY